jgi:hypothetical protein
MTEAQLCGHADYFIAIPDDWIFHFDFLFRLTKWRIKRQLDPPSLIFPTDHQGIKPMIRAKFTCQQNTLNHETQTATVILHPVTTNPPSEENLTFWQATPAGRIEL